MGIRPRILLVCGITNLQCQDGIVVDPRYAYAKETVPEKNQPWQYEQWLLSEKITFDEVKASDYKKISSYEEFRKGSLRGQLDGKKFEDVVYWDYSGKQNIIGVSIDGVQGIYSNLLLTHLIPELDINGKGFKEVEPLTLENDPAAVFLRRYIQARKQNPNLIWQNIRRFRTDLRMEVLRMNQLKRRIKNKQNFPFIPENVLSDTKDILNAMGLNVKESELKLFFVCSWG